MSAAPVSEDAVTVIVTSENPDYDDNNDNPYPEVVVTAAVVIVVAIVSHFELPPVSSTHFSCHCCTRIKEGIK